MFVEILELLGLNNLNYEEALWMLFGLFGQLIFFSRWIVQWLASEKNAKSVIPIPFWWFSLSGGIITFIYACHIGSFPFILAQFIGIIVYIRNIYLIIKNKNVQN